MKPDSLSQFNWRLGELKELMTERQKHNDLILKFVKNIHIRRINANVEQIIDMRDEIDIQIIDKCKEIFEVSNE